MLYEKCNAKGTYKANLKEEKVWICAVWTVFRARANRFIRDNEEYNIYI